MATKNLLDCTTSEYETWWQDNNSALERKIKLLESNLQDKELQYNTDINKCVLLALHVVMQQVQNKRYEGKKPKSLQADFVTNYIFGAADCILNLQDMSDELQRYNAIKIVYQTLYGNSVGANLLERVITNQDKHKLTIEQGGNNCLEIIKQSEQYKENSLTSEAQNLVLGDWLFT